MVALMRAVLGSVNCGEQLTRWLIIIINVFWKNAILFSKNFVIFILHFCYKNITNLKTSWE